MINKFSIEINDIQHINKLKFVIDLSENKLFCITGKNGAGKTTLIRAIKNITATDTFSTTASPYIFNSNSQILYSIDSSKFNFTYNQKLETIDTKKIVPSKIRDNIHVELPIPHGERFNHFKKLSDIDTDIRESNTLKDYNTPTELIAFLSKVYNTTRFNNLKEITIKKNKYYFIPQPEDFYIREDYFSSGEYFVISLYKLIQRKCKLIAIDEIDISLDASAQVNLIKELRNFCTRYEINIVFTTHSLPIMKTLYPSELFYLEASEHTSLLTPTSYNYVKSILFGFTGWDNLYDEGKEYYNKLKIIYIGGGSNVVDLMNRNNNDHFFSTPKNVISILDADQTGKRYCRNHEHVIFIPFESIEKFLKQLYDEAHSDIPRTAIFDTPKNLYKSLIRDRVMTDVDIFILINSKKNQEVEAFKNQLTSFLEQD